MTKETARPQWLGLFKEEQECYAKLAYFEAERSELFKQNWNVFIDPDLWDLPDDWTVKDGVSALAFESPSGKTFYDPAEAKEYAKEARNTDEISFTDECEKTIATSSNVYPVGTNVIKPAMWYPFKGKIAKIMKKTTEPYRVLYNDGEEEDFTEDQIKEIICNKRNPKVVVGAEIEKLFPIAYDGKVVGVPSHGSTHYKVCLAANGNTENVQPELLEDWVALHKLNKKEGTVSFLASICEGPDNICYCCKKQFKFTTCLKNHVKKGNCLQNTSTQLSKGRPSSGSAHSNQGRVMMTASSSYRPNKKKRGRPSLGSTSGNEDTKKAAKKPDKTKRRRFSLGTLWISDDSSVTS